MQEHVYQKLVKDTDELKQRLTHGQELSGASVMKWLMSGRIVSVPV